MIKAVITDSDSTDLLKACVSEYIDTLNLHGKKGHASEPSFSNDR